MYESDDDLDCPLCMEELDIADRSFRPCTCGYQICRFCWHHIKENLNGRCPACRREYSDQMVEFEPISADEITRIKREKKEKERQQKDMEAVNRRHLANMRVVQKNLVYVIGLHPKYATEDVIRSTDYFGQFGKIAKVVINKRNVALPSHGSGSSTSMTPSAAVYVTYQRKEDADKAIQTVDGHSIAGRILRASYGTTKYCTYYLRNMTCPNPSCLYLHEPGEEADTISKEELATGKHRMRDQMSTDDDDDDDDDYDGYGHRPSSSMTSSSSTQHLNSSTSYHSSPSISNHDFPPVGASTTASSIRKPPTLESAASISYKASPVRQHTHSSSAILDQNGDDERSALPATASWAKLNVSSPSTPVLKSASTPDRSLTPDNFGPPLSVAAAASQKQQPQQQPQSPSAMKRKIEKKKRKELQRNQESAAAAAKTKSTSTTTIASSSPSSSSSLASLSHPTTPMLVATGTTNGNTMDASPLSSMKSLNDALVNFVLGDAMEQVGWMPSQDDMDETPVGVSALHRTEDDEDRDSREPLTPPSLATLNNAKSDTYPSTISTLDFLLNAVPTPTYRGSFNPFAHQILRSSGNLFESPMRKTSRFGFAQI